MINAPVRKSQIQRRRETDGIRNGQPDRKAQQHCRRRDLEAASAVFLPHPARHLFPAALQHRGRGRRGQIRRQGGACGRRRRDGYAHQFVCRLFCRAFLGRNRHHFPILRREKGEAHRGLGAHRRRDGHRRRPAADCGRNASGADDAANDGYARRRPCAGRNLSAHLFRRNGFQPALQHRLRHPARHRQIRGGRCTF